MKKAAWCSINNGIYISNCGNYVCWFRADRYGLSISYDEKFKANRFTIDRIKNKYQFVCGWKE